MSKINVMIVDDSAVLRQVLSQQLENDPSINISGVAADPIYAMEKMKKQWPDVLVLDVEMPRMDGISFLKKIMEERPTPVIICSTLTDKGAQTSMQALQYGAVSVISKPKGSLKKFLEDDSGDIVAAVKAAGAANVKKLRTTSPVARKIAKKENADAVIPAFNATPMVQTTDQIIAIGTSTGGTQALEAVLTQLPRVSPGIVVVQHMPEKFTEAFANRLNSLCEIEVIEANNNDRVLPGRALIAPGGKHMLVKRSGAQYLVEVVDGPLVNRHKPSVDVLFRSVAKSAGKNALGIIMTGMGDDGAAGLLEMRNANANTIAQDEASCVVFGMPKEAIKRGAAEKVISLEGIPGAIGNWQKK